MPVLASPLGLLPDLASLAVRNAGSPAGVSFLFTCRYAIPCGLCGPRARFFGFAPRVCSVCVRSCSRGVRPHPPPPRVSVARALRAVPVQGAGRAVSCAWFDSAFPAPVPCSAYLALWGLARSLRPLAWLGVARPPAGRPAFARWVWALWGRHEGARRGAPLAWVWGVLG